MSSSGRQSADMMTEPSPEGRRRLGGDHEDGAHGVDVSVGRLALRHLQRRDAERPDVCHAVVADLLDHFRRHPERRAYHCVALCHCVLGNGGFE